jgi:hypothetical protein
VVTEGRKYDLYSQDFFADAYATFAQMREHDPVFCQPGLDGETPIWWVTRYDDAESVLLDDERFVRDPRLALPPEQRLQLPEFFSFIDSNMLNRDGDDHRRLRRLVSKAFTPRMVEQLRPRIQEIADGLIDGVSAAGEMELVSAFAFPLPITVIAELLGVPVADRERFRKWSGAMVSPALAAAEMEQADALLGAFVQYLLALFAERRGSPGDDLVSALVAVEDGGDTLSEEELCSMVALLIVAIVVMTVSGGAIRMLKERSFLTSDLQVIALHVVRWALSGALLMACVSLLYQAGDPRPAGARGRRRFRLVTPGTVVAAAMFIALSQLLAAFFRHFTDYNALYGSIGAILAVLGILTVAVGALRHFSDFILPTTPNASLFIVIGGVAVMVLGAVIARIGGEPDGES